ncbi:hypothetical protein ACFUIW_05640 [Streptomyces sp. NPDC057245]|nr:hypothetical protein [Streptomyces sp. A108]MBU6530720.1 hypothetical protein [Streptomyces sp. A108]
MGRRDVRGHDDGIAAEYDERAVRLRATSPGQAEFVIRLDQPDPGEYYR